MAYKKIAGVYRFTNKIIGKVYIGSSNNLTGRRNIHQNPNKVGAQNLRRALDKYGLENFYYEVLEHIDKDINLSNKEFLLFLRSREQVYLDFYFAKEYSENKKDTRFIEMTYNLSPKATGGFGLPKGHVHTPEAIYNIGKGIKEAYQRKRENEGPLTKICSEKELQRLNTMSMSMRRSILQLDRELNIVNRFESLKAASISTGSSTPVIGKCCKGERNCGKGFAFCYEEELDKLLERIKNNVDFFNGKHHKKLLGVKRLITKPYPVKITNLLTFEENTFYNLKEASKILECSHFYLKDISRGRYKNPKFKIEKL